ncbi:small ubiquitin-related modifier 2-like [Gastrolobium bilobum]|uniref:small ubiquitin-related modifier 2-like n=1 Tax=Gastrolobium bilobum TaxID=150636 RepID=UPI002AB12CB8|nr:small ubiquitin-related modifier 2-like [Gastrolobium bilobum]
MASNGRVGKRKNPDEVAADIIYVAFSIRGQDGRQLFFKVNQDSKLIRVFRDYCHRLNLEFETMNFLYEGSYVNGKRHTPKKLNMKNGDEILAARHQTGGGVAALNF